MLRHSRLFLRPIWFPYRHLSSETNTGEGASSSPTKSERKTADLSDNDKQRLEELSISGAKQWEEVDTKSSRRMDKLHRYEEARVKFQNNPLLPTWMTSPKKKEASEDDLKSNLRYVSGFGLANFKGKAPTTPPSSKQRSKTEKLLLYSSLTILLVAMVDYVYVTSF